MRIVLLLSTVLFVILSTGCSTVVNGTSQVVTITSNVKGADIVVDGGVVGQTPYTGPIKRGATTLALMKEGYDSKTIALNTETQTAFWGNGFWLYLFPFSSTTDAISGSMYKYAPANFEVDLTKKQ